MELQIQVICNVRLAGDVPNMLDHLPKSLVATFEEIYRRIQSQEGQSPIIAKTVLMWVMCALNPLSPVELGTIISRSVGVELEMDDILPMCSNLVKIDEALNVVRFFHLSVSDYLAKEPWFTVLDANTMASEFCLTMLNNPSEFGCINKYLVMNWPFYLERCLGQNINHPVWQMLRAFFGCFSSPSRAYCDWRRKLAVVLEGPVGMDFFNRRNMLTGDTIPSVISAKFGFFEQIRDLWDQKTCDINLTSSGGVPILSMAVKYRSGVQMLLDMGADVNFQGGQYGNALQAAAKEGNQAVVQLLLDRGADINCEGDVLGSPLSAAAGGGHHAVVQLLLDNRADINDSPRDQGSCALRQAATYGRQAVVQLLIDRGANINAKDSMGFSALYKAVKGGHQAVAKLLLDNGADVSSWSDYGTVLEAAMGTSVTMVQLLLDKGADVNVRSRFVSSIVLAASHRKHEIVQLLIDIGVDVNTQSGSTTALMNAAQHGDHATVQLLIDNGANLHGHPGYGLGLAIAAQQGDQRMVQLLVGSGANVNAGTSFGTPLQLAVGGGHQAVVQFLLDHGADMVSKENE